MSQQYVTKRPQSESHNVTSNILQYKLYELYTTTCMEITNLLKNNTVESIYIHKKAIWLEPDSSK